MKKVLFVFLFLFISEVEAKTYYSDYSDFSSYSFNEIVSNDLIEVDTMTMYQLYSEEEVYEYLENYDGEATGNIKEVETEWVDNYDLVDNTKNVQECYKEEIMNIKELKHLYIDNQSNIKVLLKRFRVISKSGEVIVDSSNITLFDFTVFHLDLTKYDYTMDEVRVEALYEKYNQTDVGELSLGYYLSSIDDHTLLKYKIKDFNTNLNSIDGNIDDFSGYSRYSSVCSETKSNKKNYKTYYRNKYILTEYKVLKKNYIDEYALEPRDGFLIDMESAKKFYRYRTRDKVSIKDNLIIDSYDVKLTDFIYESSIPLEEIKIVSNVDYSKNGEYKINFVLPFRIVEEDLRVNIEANLVNTINKQVDYINELKNSNEQNSYAVDKKNLEIKELIVEEETKVIDTLNKLDACYKNVSNLKSQKQILKIESKENRSKKIYLFILIVLITGLIVIKKNIHKKII